MILTTWRPSQRNIKYAEKPDWVPDHIYNEAMAAKRAYNRDWEFWVWSTSQDFNVPVHVAEDACIRGIKKEFYKYSLVHGEKIGKWFEEFLEMGDIFNKVKHPEYEKKLGYTESSGIIKGENYGK